jgi:hypothetical protein
MTKRLLAALLIALLAGLALRGVTPAYASISTRVDHILSLRPQTASPSIGSVNQGVYSFIKVNSTYTQQLSHPSLASLTRGTAISSAGASKLNLSSALLDVEPPHQVAMGLSGSSHVNLADPIMLNGTLHDQLTGGPVTNKTITFTTNDIDLGQTHTDDQGRFKIQIHKDLPADTYQVTASFKGAHLLAPASSTISIEVLPAIFRVQTVPDVPDVTFQIDGRQFVSDENGMASIQLYHTGDYQLLILLDLYHNPSQRVEFGRWADENYQPEHDIHIPGDYAVQVGLNIFHQVSMDFIDLDGLPVDASRISTISIRSVQGDVFTLKPGDQPWLPSSRTARRQTGLEVTNLLYSVNSVIINGSNVVNSAQQRFYVKPDDTWNISLLLYSMHITTKDGLFASPVGQSVNVTLPDGKVENYPLNAAGSLDIYSLPRGIYHISLPGVNGLGTSTPVALSRNQVVNLRVVTTLDMGVVGFLSIGLALGLIFYGRPWLLGFIFKRKRSPSHNASDINP